MLQKGRRRKPFDSVLAWLGFPRGMPNRKVRRIVTTQFCGRNASSVCISTKRRSIMIPDHCYCSALGTTEVLLVNDQILTQ